MAKKYFFIVVIISISLFAVIFNSCAAKKNLAETPVSFDSIHFGKGGGFTNQTENYAINNRGIVFKEIMEELVEINQVDYARIVEIDKKLCNIHLDSIDLKEVGNMTYFIEVFVGESSHKVTWKEPADNLNLKEFYEILVATLQNP